jgi:hypothetical protein
MENPFTPGISGLIESHMRGTLEREFEGPLPHSSERLLDDIGFFEGDRWHKEQQRPGTGPTLASLLLQHWASFRGAHA